MTEPKKVAFTTLGPIKKDNKREKKVKSVRIILTLPESNEKSCPEFNYRELVSLKLHDKFGKKQPGDVQNDKFGKKPPGEVLNGPSLDPRDPFAKDAALAEDAALKALARQFENRYGGYTPVKKKKRRKENDFSTLGEGYDETDPFIDNSDAFDEVMPVHMETKERGFYINSGELDFEEVEEGDEESSSSSEGEDAKEGEPEVKRKKVTRIESDDEEEEEEADEDNEQSKKRKLQENGIIRPKKRKLDEGELLRKRKKMIGRFNAAKKIEKRDSSPETEKPEKVVNGCEKKDEAQPGDQSIAASIEAVVSQAREEAVDKKTESQDSKSSGSDSSSSDSDSSGSSSSSDSDSDEEEEEEGETEEKGDIEAGEEEETGEAQDAENGVQTSETENNIQLPDTLPADLVQVINKLKEEGRSCQGSSQKFFTDAVNKLLLSIEIKLNKTGYRKKTQVYNHLSQHLPCGTQTIIKRAKNLLNERQESRLREPLQKLKEAVDAHMPKMLEQHALECQKAAESNPQQYWELYYHFWGENGAVQNEDNETQDGDKKKSRLPKKKFLFNDNIRKILCDVVTVRVKFWQMIKKRSETPEEHIRAFLDSEVRPLWPKGWTNPRILYKESYEAHAVITDKNVTPLKPTPGKKILTSGTVDNSGTSSPQPPKPSVSATAVPKAVTPSSGKIELAKKKVISEPKPVVPALKPTEAPATSSHVGLSIKSVEKINETINETVPEVSSQKASVEENTTKAHINKPTEPEAPVSVIDLSSDDDKSMSSKVPSNCDQSSKPKETEATRSTDKDVVNNSSMSLPPSVSSVSDQKNEDNLEDEMNLVVNELLQISKQKSTDEIETPTSQTKESTSSVSVITSTKQQEQDKKKHSDSSPQKLHDKEKPSEVQQQKHSLQNNSSAGKPNAPSMQQSQASVKPQTLVQPGNKPLVQPGNKPLVQPGNKPLVQPSNKPLVQPGNKPLVQPSNKPLVQPGNKQSNPSLHSSQNYRSQQQHLEGSQSKSQSQQYSHQKQSSSGSSSWNKQESPSKSLPASTNKTSTNKSSSPEAPTSKPMQTEAFPIGNKKSSGGSSSSTVPGANSASGHSRPASSSSHTPSYSSSHSKHSSSGHHYSSQSSKHSSSQSSKHSSSQSSKHSSSQSSKHSSQSSKHSSTPPKPRIDPYSSSVGQSSFSREQQLKAYKQQLYQQTNHLTPQQQQDIWQQMSGVTGMSGSLSNPEVYKLMSQMGKSIDSYTASQQGSGQHPGKY